MNILSILNIELVLIFEIGIALIVIGSQIYFFVTTVDKIKSFKQIFPNHSLSEKNIQGSSGDTETELIHIDNEISPGFGEIVLSINRYLEKNKGAADFEIMKSIVERNINSYEDEIMSQINVPLYIGLMGTFTGIIAGLINIGFKGGVTDEANINSFIIGVIIAMSASFIGLLLTVINNAGIYKRARSINEKGKNDFFNFLQVELLPYIGNGLSEVVTRFKDNINKFNTNFGKNIKIFDEKLSDNISSLDKSVTLIANNISPLVENTKSNYDILRELLSYEFQEMVKANLKLIEMISTAVPNLNEFMKKQQELNLSIDKTTQVVSTIESVLNRVKGFEEGINALGDRINNADYMGSDLLIKVNKKLEELDNQFLLLKQHSQITSGQIEAHLTEEKQKIEILSRKALGELQEAMQFNVETNPLKKLELLESIDKNLNEIQSKLSATEHLTQLSSDLSSAKNYIKEIKDNFHDAGYSKNYKHKEIEEYPTSGNGLEETIRTPKTSIWKKIFPFIKKKRGRKA